MKTQKINRKDLAKIYDQVCEGWQKKIASLVLFQSGEEIEADNSLVNQAFNEANDSQKKLLQKYFDVKSTNIIDRIKTWDDVVREYGKEIILPYPNPINKQQKSVNAFFKIQIISEVFNEGWVADFNNRNQSKYYIWFEKNPSGWVFGFCDGLCFYGGVGFGFYFETSEIATHVGKNFIDIFNEYLP